MLLVTGPSGNVGAELTAHLARSYTAPWRVGSRHPERLTDTLAGSSAEAVRLDFHDRSTWVPALHGVDQMFLLFPLPSNTAARAAIVPFIAAAGCRHVVYISVLGADRARFIPHFTVEARAAPAHSGLHDLAVRIFHPEPAPHDLHARHRHRRPS